VIFAVIVAIAFAVAIPILIVIVQRHRHAARHRKTREEIAKKGGERIPLTLHPVIDPDICIGSLTCLKSCPEGDILGVVNGAARLIHGDHCIGHGRCAAECPVDAIKLVFGTAERGIDLPMVDRYFESSRPGVHIIGELGGMGLIKNAITQGVQVADRLAKTLPRSAGSVDVVDVVVVGAGPAGLAAALGLRAAGRSFRVLEQGLLGGTIAQYPRQKVVMTEAVQLPLVGKFGKKLISKEELLALWQRAVEKGKIQVEESVKVASIEGADGAFEVMTNQGAVRARKVVLATGRRGTPRKLGVPGEELPKVTYNLIDPQQYEDCSVLVVGGGDAALEAAIQLAESTDAKVSISYRGDAFGRVRDANRKKIEELIAARRIEALMKSTVEKITSDEVVLTLSESPIVRPNDYVIASIGGELPLEFLGKAGVSLKRYFEEELGGKEVAPKAVRGSAGRDFERRKSHRMRWLYAALGTAILVWLGVVGWSYYWLPHSERLRSPLHAALRPAGPWGHGVGIVATLFMLSNFLYPLRKRLRSLSGVGRIADWLDFHTFVGFMSPLVIAFHAAFQSNNTLATATSASLGVVVFTGIVGRYIYGLVPSAAGKIVAVADLLGKWERLRDRMRPLVEASDDPEFLHSIFDKAATPARGGSLTLLFIRLPFLRMRDRLRMLRARFHFADHGDFLEFQRGYRGLEQMRLQVSFYDGLKRLLRNWRMFHTMLAVFLVFAIAAHIAVSLYFGYRWLF
jgi:thioredoxin reductase/Pyruvate/2-oxoacid:ferredoxin oxidoreductase delta subunit